MKVHSAIGRRLGIGREEIEKLLALEREDFPFKQWLALRYARDWIFLNGEEPAGDYMDDYYRLYTPREQGYILKLIRMMRFANYWNNTFHGIPWRRDAEVGHDACSLEPGDG